VTSAQPDGNVPPEVSCPLFTMPAETEMMSALVELACPSRLLCCRKRLRNCGVSSDVLGSVAPLLALAIAGRPSGSSSHPSIRYQIVKPADAAFLDLAAPSERLGYAEPALADSPLMGFVRSVPLRRHPCRASTPSRSKSTFGVPLPHEPLVPSTWFLTTSTVCSA
jgi:hypothetical protein